MLGSSNQLQQEDKSFNSQEFFKRLCIGTKIYVPETAEINFPKGWSHIVFEFVTKVKNYAIQVTEISDVYSMLDIHFEVIKTTKETQVWRSVNYAGRISRLLCANCGDEKSIRRRVSSTTIFCEKCNSNAHVINKTGTWLDKY